MLKLSADNIPGTLTNCFKLLSEYVAGKGDQAMGGGSVNGRLGKQADMALASRVVGFIDNRLPEDAKNFYRFVYGCGDPWEYYCGLQQHCNASAEPLLVGRSEVVCVNAGKLAVLAPWEARYRVHNRGKMQHTYERLWQMLGVSRSTFKRYYVSIWREMVDGVVAIGDGSQRLVEEKILELLKPAELSDGEQKSVRRRSEDAKFYAKELRKERGEKRGLAEGVRPLDVSKGRPKLSLQKDIDRELAEFFAEGGEVDKLPAA